MAENVVNKISTLLNGAIDNDDTTLTVDATAGFPSPQFRLVVQDSESDDTNREIMTVTATPNSTTFTVTRGSEGTTGVSHGDNSYVVHVLTAGGLTTLIDEAVGSVFVGNVLTAAPAFYTPTTSNVSNAALAFAFPIIVPGPMRVREMLLRIASGGTGNVQWGVFDLSSDPTAATKLVGGTSAAAAVTSIQSFPADSAPVSIDAGSYIMVIAMPSSNQPGVTTQSLISAIGGNSKTKDPYTWDDTPDFTTGWADGSNVPLCWLSGDIDGSTQW